jgi:hypothetical protein
VSRLHSIMEVFVFLQMGGDHEQMVIKPLHDRTTSAMKDHIGVNFSRFDVTKARCFLQSDRQKVLAVIEAAFGDLNYFNSVFRKLTEDRLIAVPSGLDNGTQVV